MKSIVGIEINHDLNGLYEKFKAFLKEQYNQKPPSWFDRIIEAFSYSDPKGTAFRYGITISEELYADMKHIQTMMNWLSESFHRIKIEEEKRKSPIRGTLGSI